MTPAVLLQDLLELTMLTGSERENQDDNDKGAEIAGNSPCAPVSRAQFMIRRSQNAFPATLVS
jgi:hypothetical protein